MPDERVRAIRWGGELLAQIATDDSLPCKAMDAAKRIALTYPTPQLLQRWLQCKRGLKALLTPAIA